MKNILKIDHAKRIIVMDRTFDKMSKNTMSKEYAHLQQVRKDYPLYDVIVRTIKTNHSKNTYRGLTYEYMYHYISTNKSLTPKEKETLSDKLSEMIQISKCQSLQYRYPVIKKWFLEKFPEIKQFAEIGIKIQEDERIQSDPALIEDIKIA